MVEKPHEKLKKILKALLEKKLGISIEEYNDDGGRLDVFCFNYEGISILVEIIWKNKYLYDMVNVLRSPRKIKVVIANPDLLNDNIIVRDFNKCIWSEMVKGYILLGLYDGKKILDNDEAYICKCLNDIKQHSKKISIKEKLEFQRNFDMTFNKAIDYLNDGNILGASEVFNDLEELIQNEIMAYNVINFQYGIKELFNKLYIKHEHKLDCIIDISKFAYSFNKELFLYIIQTLNFIGLDSFLTSNITMGERCSKLLLLIGRDYLDRDIMASRTCHLAIDNIAGDMFEPEIFSKQIIFGSLVHEQSTSNEKLIDFRDDIINSIISTYEVSFDEYGDENYTFLKKSFELAVDDQNEYLSDVTSFRDYFFSKYNLTT